MGWFKNWVFGQGRWDKGVKRSGDGVVKDVGIVDFRIVDGGDDGDGDIVLNIGGTRESMELGVVVVT